MFDLIKVIASILMLIVVGIVCTIFMAFFIIYNLFEKKYEGEDK